LIEENRLTSTQSTADKLCVIAEFPWQVKCILGMKGPAPNVIAMNPSIAYSLKQSGIPFVDARSLYSHEDLWSRYPKTNDLADQLGNRLDQILQDIEPKIATRNLNLFSYLNFPVKKMSDQIYYFIFVLNSYFEKMGSRKIQCVKAINLNQDDCAEIDTDQSLVSHVIGLLAPKFNLTIQYVDYPIDSESGPQNSSFSFGQPKFIKPLRASLRKYRSILKNITSFSKSNHQNKHVLSLSCREIDSIVKELKPHGIIVHRYAGASEALFETGHKYEQSDFVIDEIVNDKLLQELVSVDGISYLNLLMSQVRALLDQIDRYIRIHDQCMAEFEKYTFDIGFVQSVAPYYLPNIFFLKYCQEKNIPVSCWMHGGYGAYKSLSGYDITDYRHCKNHALYGNAVKDCITSSWKYINVNSDPAEYLFQATGSPYLNKMYHHLKMPKTTPKKKIVLAIGNYYAYNSFYFGYDRKHAEFCNLESHRAIIEHLCKYSDQYEIIIKDYPHKNNSQIWKSILNTQNTSNIKLVTNEMVYSDIAKSADAIILTWLSTTFIEALHTYADILVFDDSEITETAHQVLDNAFLFDQDLDLFLKKLESYLDKNEFATQDKSRAIEYFVDDVNLEQSVLKTVSLCNSLTSSSSFNSNKTIDPT